MIATTHQSRTNVRKIPNSFSNHVRIRLHPFPVRGRFHFSLDVVEFEGFCRHCDSARAKRGRKGKVKSVLIGVRVAYGDVPALAVLCEITAQAQSRPVSISREPIPGCVARGSSACHCKCRCTLSKNMGKPVSAYKKSEEVNATFKKDVRAHQQHSQASGTANMDSETQNTANLCDRLLDASAVCHEVKKRCHTAVD